MRALVSALCLLALAAPVATAAGQVPAVAVVTDLAGPVQVQRAGQRHELAVLASLAPGDEVRLGPGAWAEIAFTAGDGSVFGIGGAGRFTVATRGIQPRDTGCRVEPRDLAAAWRTLQLRTGQVGRASIALRGTAASPMRLRAP